MTISQMFKLDLLPNEKILNLYRQSETVLFKPVLIVFVLIYFPWYFLLQYDLITKYPRLLFFWTVLVLFYALYKYLLWLLNLYIVTNKRLVSINYQGLLNKKVLESPLDRILNVSFSQKGFWQSLFSFGTVETQVAGLSEPIVFQNVSKPSQVKDFLWQVHNKKPENPQNPIAQPQPNIATSQPTQPKPVAAQRPKRMDF